MAKQINQLQKNIMRRVYYAYVLRLVLSPVTFHMAVLLVAGYMLGKLVHVAAVYHNLLNVRVGELGGYVVATLLRADVATLIVFGIMVFTALSLQWRLFLPRVRTPHFV